MSLDNAFCTKSDSSWDAGHYCANSRVLSIFALESHVSIYHNVIRREGIFDVKENLRNEFIFLFVDGSIHPPPPKKKNDGKLHHCA
jgi:hypothetical protein